MSAKRVALDVVCFLEASAASLAVRSVFYGISANGLNPFLMVYGKSFIQKGIRKETIPFICSVDMSLNKTKGHV